MFIKSLPLFLSSSCMLPSGLLFSGGREKAPAAFCRKAICSTEQFEMWGDGEQTRSFMFVEDCVEGTLRIMHRCAVASKRGVA